MRSNSISIVGKTLYYSGTTADNDWGIGNISLVLIPHTPTRPRPAPPPMQKSKHSIKA